MPSLPATGVVLDPSLSLLQITGPTVVYGTADVQGQGLLGIATGRLELAKWDFTLIQTLEPGTGRRHHVAAEHAPLGTLDPSQLLPLSDGYYVPRLVALDSQNNSLPIGQPPTSRPLSASMPINSQSINLPLGAEPDGIAIDPQGNYAFVADARPYACWTEQLDQSPGRSNSATWRVRSTPRST